jgi:hypothetical protein
MAHTADGDRDLRVEIQDARGLAELGRSALRARGERLHAAQCRSGGFGMLPRPPSRLTPRPEAPGQVRRGGRVVRQRPAKPRTPVRFRSPPRIAAVAWPHTGG